MKIGLRVSFSYFTTQHWDRLQFSIGIELMSFKSQDLLPSASHIIVNHIHFSIQFSCIDTISYREGRSKNVQNNVGFKPWLSNPNQNRLSYDLNLTNWWISSMTEAPKKGVWAMGKTLHCAANFMNINFL